MPLARTEEAVPWCPGIVIFYGVRLQLQPFNQIQGRAHLLASSCVSAGDEETFCETTLLQPVYEVGDTIRFVLDHGLNPVISEGGEPHNARIVGGTQMQLGVWYDGLDYPLFFWLGPWKLLDDCSFDSVTRAVKLLKLAKAQYGDLYAMVLRSLKKKAGRWCRKSARPPPLLSDVLEHCSIEELWQLGERAEMCREAANAVEYRHWKMVSKRPEAPPASQSPWWTFLLCAGNCLSADMRRVVYVFFIRERYSPWYPEFPSLQRLIQGQPWSPPFDSRGAWKDEYLGCVDPCCRSGATVRVLDTSLLAFDEWLNNHFISYHHVTLSEHCVQTKYCPHLAYFAYVEKELNGDLGVPDQHDLLCNSCGVTLDNELWTLPKGVGPVRVIKR